MRCCRHRLSALLAVVAQSSAVAPVAVLLSAASSEQSHDAPLEEGRRVSSVLCVLAESAVNRVECVVRVERCCKELNGLSPSAAPSVAVALVVPVTVSSVICERSSEAQSPAEHRDRCAHSISHICYTPSFGDCGCLCATPFLRIPIATESF